MISPPTAGTGVAIRRAGSRALFLILRAEGSLRLLSRTSVRARLVSVSRFGAGATATGALLLTDVSGNHAGEPAAGCATATERVVPTCPGRMIGPPQTGTV